MARTLPSLQALEAFEAAARHQSFTRAAAELHVTQGAVSRQVQGLEAQLGLALFHRIRQRIRLTPAGEAYLAKVRPALDRLEAATLELKASGGAGGVLNLAVLPTFATKWLIPRIPAFTAAHPEILVTFTTRIQAFDFDEEPELDAAIHYGEGVWPGARLEPLMDERVVAVCAPALAAALHAPGDLAGQTLLQLLNRPQGWEEWLAAAGAPEVDGRRGPRFESHLMVIQAALAGLGLAVLPDFLVADELAAGRLVEPFPGLAAKSRRSYWLATPERAQDLPALAAFRAWLLKEIEGR
ncbi:MAG TPA: transcriptional regulator GcvA [Holophagaceae bacterium]|nr:transcriptional regulator GcvA [Holophagaceae bacterium]